MFNASLFGSASRRDFLKTITAVTAAMGLPATMVPKVAEAAETSERPSVIWLHFQECTGCSESLLRAGHPGVAELLLDIISLEYHETLMPGSGPQAEEALHSAQKKYAGQYILVVEGSIPLGDDSYCKVGGKTAKDSLEELARDAFAVICMGTCASLGGLPAATGPDGKSPTTAVSAASLVNNKPLINLPGCPPNAYNLPATILYFLTFGKLPEMDKQNRPLFAYGRLIHDHCERRSHFDAGRFAKAYGDKTHAEGYCLYELGCKGPATYANCTTIRFNDGAAWPVSVGHPCVGCTEHLIFNTEIAEKVQIYDPAAASWFPPAEPKLAGKPTSALTGAAIGAVAGAAIGFAAGKGSTLPNDEEE